MRLEASATAEAADRRINRIVNQTVARVSLKLGHRPFAFHAAAYRYGWPSIAHLAREIAAGARPEIELGDDFDCVLIYELVRGLVAAVEGAAAS